MQAIILLMCAITISAGCHQLNGLIGTKTVGIGGGPSGATSAAPSDGTTPTEHGGSDEPPAISGSVSEFCKEPSSEGTRLSELQEGFKNPDERHTFRFFLTLHWSMCKREPEAGVVSEGMKMRATIMRELGLTEADMKDLSHTVAMTYREGPIGFDTKFLSAKNSDLKSALTANPFDQQGLISYAYDYHPMYGLWLADSLGDRLTELSRAALVRACLRDEKDLLIAACLPDARRIDRKKLWRELDDPAFTPDVRLSLKFWFIGFTKQIATAERAIAARVRDDAGYKTVFVDVPTTTHKQWAAFYKANPALVALTRELEYAAMSQSRKATAGCEAKVTPHLARHLKTIKPDSELQLRLGGSGTPSGWITNAAGYYCAKATDGPWSGLEHYFGEELTHDMWLRGPRTAIVETLLARSRDLKFDDRKRSIADDMPRDAYRATSAFGVAAGGTADRGVVRKLAPKGDLVEIAFADGEMDELTCEKRVKTEKWRYDRQTGEVSPVYDCVKFGSRRVKTTNPPAVFPRSMMTGIAPGRLVQFARGKQRSTPAYVWDSQHKRKLIAAYGLAR